jgi:hypothetical protein
MTIKRYSVRAKDKTVNLELLWLLDTLLALRCHRTGKTLARSPVGDADGKASGSSR